MNCIYFAKVSFTASTDMYCMTPADQLYRVSSDASDLADHPGSQKEKTRVSVHEQLDSVRMNEVLILN